MIKFSRFKTFVCLVFLISAVFMITSALYAESVFLKDGSIVEGKISKEDDNQVVVKIASGETQKILRTDILRTLFHYKYKDKKFLSKTDGTEIEAYIVDEDAENYICRTNLNSADEMKILKDDIKSISKEKIPEPYYIPPTGYYLRGIVPGWGQLYSGHYAKGAFFGLSFIGSATWAVVANVNYYRSKKNYDSLSTDNTQEDFNNAYNQKNDDYRLSLWSVITSAAIYVLNWGDILFLSTPESGKPVSMYQCGEVSVNLNILPDYTIQEFPDYLGGLKTEMVVSLKF